MLSFKSLLLEKIKIHQNKSINIYFNSYKDHSLEDKLVRADIKETEFKQILNKITKRIKTDKLDSNNFVFTLDKFKLPVYYDKQKKELLIRTILTKSMKTKKDDKILVVESIDYIIINMEN